MSAVSVDYLLSWSENLSRNTYQDIEDDDKLRIAVKLNDLDKVLELLSTGGNPNLCEQDCNEDYLLHFVQSAAVARALLSRGANVNVLNANFETPLNAVVKNKGSLELVKVLLKYGADVNHVGCARNTALTLALKDVYDARVVGELLKYGADVTIRRPTRWYWYSFSPLASIFRGHPRFRDVLIKYFILFNLDRNYQEINNFTDYENAPNYRQVLKFIEDCACEVNRMKTDYFGNRSVYSLVTTKDDLIALYPGREFKENYFVCTYPIYGDILTDTVEVFLRRGELLNRLSETEVFTMFVSSEGVVEKITLDCDSVMIVANYLSNDDLSNLLKAVEVAGAYCCRPSSEFKTSVYIRQESDEGS